VRRVKELIVDETMVHVGLSGHDLLVLKMAVESELEFWRRLQKQDRQRSAGGPGEPSNTEQCVADLTRLEEKLGSLLDALPLALDDRTVSGACKD